LLLLALTACASPAGYLWSSFPEVKSVATPHFEIALAPLCEPSGCTGFNLKIVNTGASDVEILWDETLFIQLGQTFGGFMFEGIPFEERNLRKPNDVVFPRGSLEKRIWPTFLVQREGGWRHGAMPFGEQGIYLKARVGGQEVREKVTLHLLRREKGGD
jgi:hypothetical protein